MTKKILIKDFYKYRRKDWYDHENIDMESAKQQHRDNLKAIEAALEWRKQKERPLTVAVFHGSGRHPTESCAHEMSNSQMLLERGLEMALEEWEGEVWVDRHILREYVLEECNSCLSTCSALCNFSCTCFPGDDISTRIYPAVIGADVLLWSTQSINLWYLVELRLF